MRWKAGPEPISSAMAEKPAAIRLVLVGRDAADCLKALATDGGSVLAVFRRSAYLSHDGSGAIACIGPAALGAGPLNALAEPDKIVPDWQEAGLRPGDPVTPENGGLRIGGLRVPTFAGARLHDPPRGPCAMDEETVSPTAFAQLSRGTCRIRPGGGTRAALPPGQPRAAAHFSADTASAAGDLGACNAGWPEGAATPTPRDAVERLIGLGPGLTPSGDDFLGGAMIALSMSGDADTAVALAGPVLAAATDGTNRISAAHLRAAARGFGADALHRCIDALAGNDRKALASALARLDAIGHSSGWDALAGAVTALQAIDRRLAAQPARRALI